VRSSAASWLSGARMLRRMQPRLSELLEFAAVVSTNDGIAPALGRRRLEDHFRGEARSRQQTGRPASV
jgi:hypothetical protein